MNLQISDNIIALPQIKQTSITCFLVGLAEAGAVEVAGGDELEK